MVSSSGEPVNEGWTAAVCVDETGQQSISDVDAPITFIQSCSECSLWCPFDWTDDLNLTVPRSDWLFAGHPDVTWGDHQEPGPGAEPAEGEAQQAGGGEGGSAQPEPGGQRAAQTTSAQTRTGTGEPFSPVWGLRTARGQSEVIVFSPPQSLREEHQGYEKELSRLRGHYEEEMLRFREAQVRALEEMEEKHQAMTEEAQQEKQEEKKLLMTVS